MSFKELLNIERPKIFGIKDLELMRTSLTDDIDYLYERYAEKKIDWQEYQDLVAQLHQQIIEKMIVEKEKLAHIFQTGKGSYYFVLHSGYSWRIKSKEGVLASQPIMDNIFFLDDKIGTKILDEVSEQGANVMVDQKIECVDYQINARPLELGLHNYYRPALERSKGYIKILGTMPEKSDELEKTISFGAHIGHEITEIIK